VAILHRRYETLRCDQPIWMKARAAQRIYTFGEKGLEAKGIFTGVIIAYGINSLAGSLANCTSFSLFCVTGIPEEEKHRRLEDMSGIRNIGTSEHQQRTPTTRSITNHRPQPTSSRTTPATRPSRLPPSPTRCTTMGLDRTTPEESRMM
jgi:hypothetical protein